MASWCTHPKNSSSLCGQIPARSTNMLHNAEPQGTTMRPLYTNLWLYWPWRLYNIPKSALSDIYLVCLCLSRATLQFSRFFIFSPIFDTHESRIMDFYFLFPSGVCPLGMVTWESIACANLRLPQHILGSFFGFLKIKSPQWGTRKSLPCAAWFDFADSIDQVDVVLEVLLNAPHIVQVVD